MGLELQLRSVWGPYCRELRVCHWPVHPYPCWVSAGTSCLTDQSSLGIWVAVTTLFTTKLIWLNWLCRLFHSKMMAVSCRFWQLEKVECYIHRAKTLYKTWHCHLLCLWKTTENFVLLQMMFRMCLQKQLMNLKKKSQEKRQKKQYYVKQEGHRSHWEAELRKRTSQRRRK